MAKACTPNIPGGCTGFILLSVLGRPSLMRLIIPILQLRERLHTAKIAVLRRLRFEVRCMPSRRVARDPEAHTLPNPRHFGWLAPRGENRPTRALGVVETPRGNLRFEISDFRTMHPQPSSFGLPVFIFQFQFAFSSFQFPVFIFQFQFAFSSFQFPCSSIRRLH